MRRSSVAAFVLAALLGTSVVVAPAAYAADYPSWDDVLAARSSQAATQAEVARINAFIIELTDEAARLGKETIVASAAYTEAQAQFDAAAQRADRLTAGAESARAEADAAQAQFGRVASQLLVSAGGGDLTVRLLLSGTASDDLLYQLGAITKLTARSGDLEAIAQQKRNQSDLLSEQAEIARTERDRLAAIAKTAFEAAQAAEKAAGERLAAQQEAMTTLRAQLATLTSAAADVEQRYQEGESARRAAEAAAAAAAAESAGTIWTGDVVVDPAGAQAYAASAIGAYGWGGDQFSCLVRLWTKESSWRANAYNTSSGAYGIPQALPAEKMATAGVDWRTNAATQINWGLRYISGRYGSPCAALSFHLGHNWY